MVLETPPFFLCDLSYYYYYGGFGGLGINMNFKRKIDDPSSKFKFEIINDRVLIIIE